MRLFLYKISIFLIQILGKLNAWLIPYPQRYTRPDRMCYAPYEDNDDGLGKVVHISCCDCGSSHHIWKANDGIYGVPIRPEGYNYHPRLSFDTMFADDKAKRLWNTNR